MSRRPKRGLELTAMRTRDDREAMIGARVNNSSMCVLGW